MGKMPSGKGGEGDTEQEIFEGFLEKATQAIVYILARSIREKAPKEDSMPQRIMGKMPSGKGWRGWHGAKQEIFEGFLEKATQAIVYILARSIREKAPKRIVPCRLRHPFRSAEKKQKFSVWRILCRTAEGVWLWTVCFCF